MENNRKQVHQVKMIAKLVSLIYPKDGNLSEGWGRQNESKAKQILQKKV